MSLCLLCEERARLVFIYLFLITCLSGEVRGVVHCVKKRSCWYVVLFLLLLVVHGLCHHVGHGGRCVSAPEGALLGQVVDERKPDKLC